MQLTRFSLFFVLTASIACGGSGPAATGDGGVSDGAVPGDGATLEFIGSSRVSVSENSEREISVRYLDENMMAVVGGTVSFTIEGDANGATLAAMNLATDDEGVASVVVRTAGTARFRILANAPGTDGDQLQMTVTAGALTSLRITPEYTGERRIGDVDVGLFTNFRCAQFADSVPSPREVARTRVDDTVEFVNVDSATPTSIYALGYTGDGAVAVFRCLDIDFTDSLDIAADLADVIRVDGGTFEMTETFDVTQANGVLNFILGAATGLTTDPADWLIDLAIESDILPQVAEDLIDDNRSLIGGFINDFIKDLNTPDYVDELLAAGAALDRVFTELTIAGTLSISESDEFGMGTAIHRLREIRVPVGMEVVTRPLRSQRVDDVAVMFVGREQTIAPHTFTNVPFGEVIGIALNEVVLPRLPGSPRNITEVLDGLIDCEGLATSLLGEVDEDGGALDEVFRDTVEQGCEAGVRFAGEQVEEQLMSLLDWNELTLEGTGMTTDGDDDFLADAFEGTADATWSGGPSGDLEFTGTLEGVREGDASQRVVDRIAEVFAAAR